MRPKLFVFCFFLDLDFVVHVLSHNHSPVGHSVAKKLRADQGMVEEYCLILTCSAQKVRVAKGCCQNGSVTR